MFNNKGISIITLIITIILIVILAAISAPLLSSVIDDSFDEDSKVELKNVQAVVENAKTLILTDQFTPNESKYLVSDGDLNFKFGGILTTEEIEYIKTINHDDRIKAPYKFYLMDQKAFDDEFGDKFNVNGIRENREYLINYMETLVLVEYKGKGYSSKPENPIIPVEDLVRGEVKVNFYPNGNVQWARQQATNVTITAGQSTTIYSVKYMWSEEVNEPDVTSYTDTFAGVSSGTSSGPAISNYTLELKNETGNGWFVWVLVEYDDVGVRRTRAFRSEPFYIDNIAPSAVFEVDEIVR